MSAYRLGWTREQLASMSHDDLVAAIDAQMTQDFDDHARQVMATIMGPVEWVPVVEPPSRWQRFRRWVVQMTRWR